MPLKLNLKEDLIMELNLSKNTMMLDLTKAAPQLTRLRGLLNWDCHPVHGSSKEYGFDLDVFAFCTDANGSICLLYTSPSPRDRTRSRMPSSA